MSYQNLIVQHVLSFGSGGTISNSVYLNGEAIMAVSSPGTWTAAPLVFDVTADPNTPSDGSWMRLLTGASELSVPASTRGTAIYYLSVSNAPAVYWLRGFSGSGAAGTAQAADRTLTLLTRPV
jgi:hypothetical protein